MDQKQLQDIFLQITQSGSFQFPTEIDENRIAKIKKKLADAGISADDYDFKPSHPNVSEYHCNLLEEIALVFKSEGFEVPESFVGILNDGAIRAEVMPLFGEGAIISYSVGLADYAYQAYKAIACSASIGDPPIEPLFSPQECGNYLIQLATHLSLGDPRSCPELPLPSLEYISIAVGMLEGTTRFVLAHEIAHLTQEESDEKKGSHHLEFRADAHALSYLMRRYENLEETDLFESLTCTAPLLFFELVFLYRLVDACRRGQTVLDYSDHPPDLVRRDAMITQLLDSLGNREEFYPIYGRLSAPIGHAAETLLESLEKNESDFKSNSFRIACPGYEDSQIPLLLGLVELLLNKNIPSGAGRIVAERN